MVIDEKDVGHGVHESFVAQTGAFRLEIVVPDCATGRSRHRLSQYWREPKKFSDIRRIECAQQ
ncbi:hypothetical protein HT585_28700 [Ensifer sp. HO-A22]|uniref:Uncharacterized protein n=1 Tax=Ensifer oleiphilus TaxID=2742698 RepID=A0A7Y6QBY9_9HYPH|nr:hypothetical protein [Ensifer oleiphilus]NVD42853.1 hypothetical protein [Ensifer oleiphilus]